MNIDSPTAMVTHVSIGAMSRTEVRKHCIGHDGLESGSH